jgi:hypothetical protein
MSKFDKSELVGKTITLPAGSILINRWGYVNDASGSQVRITRTDDGLRAKVTGLGPIQEARKENEPIVWMGYVGKLDDEHAKPILAGQFEEVNPEPKPTPAPSAPKQMADLEKEIAKAVRKPRSRKTATTTP